MQFKDVRGLVLTTESQAAVEHFNKSIADNAEYRLSAVDHIAKSIEADPQFTMAHCVMGCYLMSAEILAPEGAARECLEAAEATDLSRVTERERMSVQALRAWVEGRQPDAINIWDSILDDYPTDLLTLQLIHYRNFWQGNEKAIRDSVSRRFPSWKPSMPNYSNILGMYSFGLNENGDPSRALELGLRAVDLNPDDLWAVHAVAHALNDTGQYREGVDFFNRFDKAWSDRNAIREHLWWHEALFEWEIGNYERVLELYDDYFAKNVTPFYLDVQNTASVLWRLESAGVDVGDRWQRLGEAATARAISRNIPFTDIHVAMILGRSGENEALESFLGSVRADSNTARRANELAAAETDIEVCEAIAAFCSGDYQTAVERLLPSRQNAYRALGASNAQRDVVSIMLGQAALKSGNGQMARSVFAQQTEAKPHSQMTWIWYANALQDCGDENGAAQARAHALALSEKLAA